MTANHAPAPEKHDFGICAGRRPVRLRWTSFSLETAGLQTPSDEDGAARAAQTILSQNCFRCHGTSNQEGGLRLDKADAALRGGDSGKVIEPGHAQRSLLIEYVSGKGSTVMPPEGKKLSPAEVATLRDWIDHGARWPSDQGPTAGLAGHWSFRPVQRPPLPTVERRDWCRGPIDRFVLARLEKEHLAPSPEADRRTLIRRLSLDLLGLPPTIEEVRAFLADTRPDAHERLVDRLLASPHFGERWGRFWLDRASFAETSGCLIDLQRPSAWQWRDWVIDAVNADMPFDEFTIEQLAGDLLPQATIPQRVAAGFHRLAPTNHEAGADLEAERVKNNRRPHEYGRYGLSRAYRGLRRMPFAQVRPDPATRFLPHVRFLRQSGRSRNRRTSMW